MEQLGHACFDAFDESLVKQKSDSDATKVFSINSKSPEITTLNTATESALRVIPERYRASSHLFTLAKSITNAALLYAHLPLWAFPIVEDISGNFTLIESNSQQAKHKWVELSLQSEDRFLHLNLFSKSSVPRIAPITDHDAFLRLADLVLLPEGAQKHRPVISISLE